MVTIANKSRGPRAATTRRMSRLLQGGRVGRLPASLGGLLLLLLVWLAPAGAPAETGQEAPCPPDQLPTTRPARGADWFEGWTDFKKDLAKATGTHINLCMFAENQVNLNGLGEGKDRTVFWWNLGVAQDLWPGARLIANARGGSGHGLDRLISAGLNTNWMACEPCCVYVSHLLLEQKLLDNKVTFWLGKLDLGDYFDANEAVSWNFLSYSLARNPTVPFPWHAIGAAVRVEPVPWFYVQAGAADAQGRWTRTGLESAFHDEDYFVSLYEFALRPTFGNLRGNYRFILWYDPQPVARIDGGGCKRDNLGFALGFDQQLTRKITGAFRYGFAHEQVRATEHFWSLGAVWSGPIAGRPRDALGFGVAQAVKGGDCKSAHPGSSATETLFEAYYTIKLAEWLSVTPDVQMILDPGAVRENDPAVVAGVKVAVTF